MDTYIQKIRDESPTLQQKTFLNHASRGPLHGRTKQAVLEYLSRWEEWNFKECRNMFDRVREQFGQLINAKKEEIAFIPDVSHGSKLAASMLKYDKNSNIVCYWNDYAGQVYQGLYLEKTKGIEYRPVPDRNNAIFAEDFAEKIDQNTVLVLLSHVQWLTGCKTDLEEICKIAHENDAYVLTDTIQSSGAMINDVKKWDVDFLTCGVTKWLLGPRQRGLFFMKEKLIEEFYPPFAGYHGTDSGSDDQPYWNVKKLEYLPSIKKFCDINTGDFIYWIAREGMQIILEYGMNRVEERIFKLTDYLIEELEKIPEAKIQSPLERNERSGIINVKVKDNVEIVKKLAEKGIVTSSRFDGIRISPHFYNAEDDIDVLISNLKELI